MRLFFMINVRHSQSYKGTTLLLLPWLLTFSLFWLYPLLYAFYVSFTQYSTLGDTSTFIGLANYTRIFSDTLFWKALANTSVFTFGTVPVTTCFALVLALALHSSAVRYKGFFRSAFFLPSVTSLVVISLIFTNLYSKSGYVNILLSLCGLPFPERGWLLEPDTALLGIMAMDVWISAGYYMVLFLAGIQAIPTDLYESALLSGANAWQRFRFITLPLLRPTMLFVIVINTIKSFQIFVEIYVMTKGGPLNATTTLVYMVYEHAFERADTMGYASALAFIVFALLLLFSAVQMKVLKQKA